jgi:Heparinase II/III-like protein/Heparinase II/III N-terminus
VNSSRLEWYLRRLEKMSASEMAWRLSDAARKLAWARHCVPVQGSTAPVKGRPLTHRTSVRRALAARHGFEAVLDPGVLATVSPEARRRVIEAADQILAGRWEVLGVMRKDLEDPDWFFDPVTGRRAPQTDYCFRIDHRSQDVTGNVKQVWELSRMHHLTVLAAAFALSGDERYAKRVECHLRSWWEKNPFLSGIHWTCGIEVGLRLITWVWIRRLLDGWEQAPALFEHNEEALAQIWGHQRYLAGFRSRGSSANNHVIAESAGQLVAALAFDWFAESPRWAAQAATVLEDELAKNTFPSGVNREMATDYHGFVAELGLVAAAEADRAAQPLHADTWQLLGRMLDVVAATVDVRLQAPRQGDGDDGRALVLTPPGADRWGSLLALGEEVFGGPDWWPAAEADVTSTLLGSMAQRHPQPGRPQRRPPHFDDAGLTIMRSSLGDGPEIWCRCDAGPHGFLSIAAHAHADALAVEVRHDGVEILADPGTYCYQGEANWRSYFRSTLGHNTVEIAHQNQSESAGSTLWRRHAHTRLLELDLGEDGEVVCWSAEHDGYAALEPPVGHRRTVGLSSRGRRIDILDEIKTTGRHDFRVAFHLGPVVGAEIDGPDVTLSWTTGDGDTASADILLSELASWRLVRGRTDPVLGWYSAHFGEKQPTTTIVGEGTCHGRHELKTILQFQA